MSMNSEQVVRSEVDYRIEQGRGRRTGWARAEGRSETVLRRGWRRIRTAATLPN